MLLPWLVMTGTSGAPTCHDEEYGGRAWRGALLNSDAVRIGCRCNRIYTTKKRCSLCSGLQFATKHANQKHSNMKTWDHMPIKNLQKRETRCKHWEPFKTDIHANKVDPAQRSRRLMLVVEQSTKVDQIVTVMLLLVQWGCPTENKHRTVL